MSEGIKHDGGKPRMHLLSGYHPSTLIDEVRVLEYGEKTYGKFNWQLVDEAKLRYEDALCRHLHAYVHGQRIDPDTGYSHLAHIRVNAAFLDFFNKLDPDYTEFE